MKIARTYSRITLEAMQLLGQQIKLARKQRHWSEAELAERAGTARATVQKIEKGDARCAIGLVFEMAILVGVPLFAENSMPLHDQLEKVRDKIALLSKTSPLDLDKDFDDDF